MSFRGYVYQSWSQPHWSSTNTEVHSTLVQSGHNCHCPHGTFTHPLAFIRCTDFWGVSMYNSSRWAQKGCTWRVRCGVHNKQTLVALCINSSQIFLCCKNVNFEKKNSLLEILRQFSQFLSFFPKISVDILLLLNRHLDHDLVQKVASSNPAVTRKLIN